MDASAPTGRHISFEEYLELERSSEIRHEYYQGEMRNSPLFMRKIFFKPYLT